MSDTIASGTAPGAEERPMATRGRRWDLQVILPAAALAVMLAVIFLLQPRAMSYNGLRLLLGLGLPLMFAAMAQLCVIAASDIDFGLGTFIGLVNCVAAKYLGAAPLLAVVIFAGLILAYAGMGAFIQVRDSLRSW